jgi:hypothetical protein
MHSAMHSHRRCAGCSSKPLLCMSHLLNAPKLTLNCTTPCFQAHTELHTSILTRSTLESAARCDSEVRISQPLTNTTAHPLPSSPKPTPKHPTYNTHTHTHTHTHTPQEKRSQPPFQEIHDSIAPPFARDCTRKRVQQPSLVGVPSCCCGARQVKPLSLSAIVCLQATAALLAVTTRHPTQQQTTKPA